MNAERYSRSAIALHWTIALLLMFQLGLGWHMTSMARGAQTYAAFQFHKSIGITILLLSALRVGIRLLKPRPAPIKTGLFAGLLAKLVHLGLYVFMIAGPLTGWLVVSSAKVAIPTRLYGVVPWPHLPLANGWNDIAVESHQALAWIGLGLISVHFAGAVRHHGFDQGENVIGRMVAGVAASPRRAIPAALAAASLLGLTFLVPWLLYRTGTETPQAAAGRATAALNTALAAQDGPNPTKPAQGHPVDKTVLTAAPAPSPTASAPKPFKWKVQAGGRLGFTASMNGTAIDGRFNRWTADILFDPDALAQSTITVRVPLLSANTDNAERDGMLQGPDFFGEMGTALFRSASIKRVAGARYAAAGTLSMNGASRPLVLVFTLHIDGNRAEVAGSTKVDRTAFGIGRGQWTSTDQIAADVAVTFKFNARKESQAAAVP